MSKTSIALTVNGHAVTGEVEPRTHLADFLREDLLLTGTHLGCEQGVCGACTVMIDGRPSRSCITLAVACDAADVRTIESFDDDPLMAQLRDAFTRHHGLQCGFCTPGLLASAYDIVRRVPDADGGRIRKELSGNLCRCTGYQGAVNAIADVLGNAPPIAELQPLPRSRARVDAAAVIAPPEKSTAADPPSRAMAVPERVDDGVRLSRRIKIEAPADQVWPVLQDIERVVTCVPGAELDGAVDGNTVRGHMTVAIGPMRAVFNGIADVHHDATARSGRVIGRGGDRFSRSSLDGEMTFKLHDTGAGQSDLELDILYQLKGPLAQFGRPAVVAEVADRLLADTARHIAARSTGATVVPATLRPVGGLGLVWAALVGLFKGLFGRR
ncbi:MAG: xanthine dehydrogenase family Fe-S subunit [Hyphomicrobiaceae bacterium]